MLRCLWGAENPSGRRSQLVIASVPQCLSASVPQWPVAGVRNAVRARST